MLCSVSGTILGIRDTVNRFGSFPHGASSQVTISANKYRVTNDVDDGCC